MFMVDITFQGDVSSAERIFVRRPYVTVGASESAHVVVTEMEHLGFTLCIQRDLARTFKVSTITDAQHSSPAFIGGTYDGRAKIDLGVVTFELVALDLDVLIREGEPLDRAGIRILRRAFSDPVPEFPALCVTAPVQALLSFWPDQPLLVGRSRGASVRLDVPTVSLQHARVGFESGQFWVEDLGSTNGTFVGDTQVSSRVVVPAGTPIFFSREVCVVGVTSREQLTKIIAPGSSSGRVSVDSDTQYPTLVSVAAVARPSRVVLRPGARLDIGRDPSCGLWLGAPHVSRRHCEVEVSKTGEVKITDSSTNGTAFDGGMLRNSEVFKTSGRPIVLDFGAGVTVALCFSADQERLFQEAHGAPNVFLSDGESLSGQQGGGGRTRVPRERRNTTWFKMDDSAFKQFQAQSGRFPTVRALFTGLTGPGRIAIAVIGAGFAVLLGVIAWMLMSGFGI